MGKIPLRLVLLIIALLLPAAPLAAAEAPVFGPIPDWVVAAQAPPAQSPATQGQAAALRLFDIQWRFDDAGSHAFARSMVRLASPEALASAGNIGLQWHPATQTITVHRLVIHRGSEVIDVAAGEPRFTVIRRESGLEQSIVDGLLTATLQIPDLRVGDSVELAITVTDRNPALGGHSQSSMPIIAPFATDRFHFVASWPSTRQVSWRAGEAFPQPRQARRDGFTTISVDQPGYAAPPFPERAPGRFLDTFGVQISDFESWQDVSAMFAGPYAEAARLGENSPLRAEVARIAAASPDPLRRAEAALALVQNQVRYVFDASGLGGYLPVSADQVWASRFGDCKGKTVLLVALLRELGIDAESALVSLTRPDGIDRSLPMPGRFDHALARVRIAGRTYWLDGTRTGDAELARLTVSPVRWALPLTAPGSTLEPVALAEAEQPTTELSIEYDMRGGITLPAGLRAELVVRGDPAVGLRRLLEFMPPAERQALVRGYWTQNFSNFEVRQADYSIDQASGTVRYSATGTARLGWDLWDEAATRRLELMRARLGQDLAPERRPGPWADLPVALEAQHFLTRYTIMLPGDGADFTLDGGDIDRTIGPTRYRRTARISRGRVEVEAATRISPGEISYAQVQADDRASDEVFAQRLFVRAPLAYEFTEAERAALPNAAESSAATSDLEVFRTVIRSVQAGNIAGAVAEVTAAIDRAGRSANLLVMRSDLHSQLGNTDLAEADLDAALALEPTNPRALLLRAQRLSAAGRTEDATMILDRLILAEPRDPFAYLMRAELRADAGRFDAALGDLDIVIQLQPENREAWIARVRFHNRRDDNPKALEAAEGFLRLFPEDATAHALHGNILAVVGRREEAAAALARSLQLEESADAYITRAAYNLSGSPEARLADLLAAIRLDPGRTIGSDVLRAVLEVDGAYQRLEAAYQAGRARLPQPDQLRAPLASLYAAAGRREELLAVLAEQIAASPRAAEPLNSRCWYRATWGIELDLALADCNASIALARSAHVLDSRGLVQLKRGDLAAAIADYDAALALRPRSPHSLYGRGIAKLRRGDRAGGEADMAAARAMREDIAEEFRRYGIEP